MQPVKNRTMKNGEKVFVYYNLHKHVFSIKSLEGENKGKVVAYAEKVALKDCEFKVSEKGRQKVLEKRQKRVHAGVVGKIDLTFEGEKGETEVTYNPYYYQTFVYKQNERPIYKTHYAYLENKKVYI